MNVRRIVNRLLGSPAGKRALDGAGAGRRWKGARTFGRINDEILSQATPLRARGLYFARNSPWLTNGVNALVAALIGTGLKPQSTHPDPAVRAALHRAWRRWCDVADADGRTDCSGLLALACRGMIEHGEAFAQLIVTERGLRIRLIDPAAVPIDDLRTLGSGHVVAGIEFDAAGNRAAYHVAGRPNDPLNTSALILDPIRIDAADMCHLFAAVAPGQVRGLSWFAPILARLHELDGYEDAALLRQRISACFAGFIVDPQGDTAGFAGDRTGTTLESGLEPGVIRTLAPGQDIRFADPALVGDAVDFIKLQLRAVAAGLGVPEYLLTGDLSQANYSSLRASLVEFRQRIEQLQYSVIVPQLCGPIWRRFVTTAVLLGEIDAPNFVFTPDEYLGCEWIAPAQPWVDPQKDAAADAIAVAAGFKSRRQVVAGLGWDIEQLDAEIAADREREQAAGLVFERPKEAAVANNNA